MKKLLLTLVAGALLALSVSYVAFAAEVKEEFSIDVIKKSKDPVKFPHKKHSADFKIECKECHHTMKTNDETPKACTECHKADAENDIAGVGKAPALRKDPEGKKNLFHDRCKECHKKKEKGPTKCKECHGGADE